MLERTVDLRSDTVTLPTEEMKEAMVNAVLGDDGYNEDATVNRLQELAAEKVGMEAALYILSGTMGNACALLAHTRPGDDVFFEERAHMFAGERGEFAALNGLTRHPMKAEFGVIQPEQLKEVIRSGDTVQPSLVCIENTHNGSGGAAWAPAAVEAVSRTARAHGMKLHTDGARIFNAATAHGVDVKEYIRHVDSVMFCVSKGLSAPVGSLVCGNRRFINEAQRVRKRLGGSMRQAGVIAAAGIVALEKMVDRLAEDHEIARLLCEGLAEIESIKVQHPPTPTNFAMLNVGGLGWSANDLVEKWKTYGILANPRPPAGARLVAHRHITAEDVGYVVDTTRRLAEAG
jgi:threonine aldolase